MLSAEENKKLSKLLSYVLRHNPAHLDLQLDGKGWVMVETLLLQLNNRNIPTSFEILKELVDTNAKKRFAFNHDLTAIRASQGHSIEIDLNYLPQTPPAILYHGTADTKLSLIIEKGLLKMNRQHVHLSTEISTAMQVGGRHGKPVVLRIQAGKMQEQGFVFYLSDNGVWLTDTVPAIFIER